jgi:hypothetical protein
MRKSLIALTVALLLLTTLSASAKSLAPGPFSTTGYTLLPPESGDLPGDYTKFHLRAQGGPDYDDDTLCQTLAPYYDLNSAESCEDLCASVGGTCGAHGYFEGSFTFDEWGILDQTLAGANEGLLTVSTGGGSADMRFGGSATDTVVGSFQILGGSGDYKKLAGVGTYSGYPGLVFKVDYTPCGGGDQPKCPTPFCAAHGETLGLKDGKATWDLVNDGKQPVVLERLLLFWPEANGLLTRVSLDGKMLAAGSWPVNPDDPTTAGWVRLDLGSAPPGHRRIPGGQRSTLTLQFVGPGFSTLPADYTFQAEFAEGCSAIHVAFP